MNCTQQYGANQSHSSCCELIGLRRATDVVVPAAGLRLTSGLLWWVTPSLLPCMGQMPNHVSAYCGTWRVLPGGMSQMFRLLFLGNGWADCVENWHALGDPLCSYSLCSSHGWNISARAHVQRYTHTALLYLGNGLVDCVQIWYVGWGSLSRCFPQVVGGVGHLCTCARAPNLRISGSDRPMC